MRAAVFFTALLASASAAAQTVTPVAIAELDYRRYAHEVEGFDGFSLARARLGLKAQLTPTLRAMIWGEWVLRETPYVLDAFVAWRFAPSWELTVGLSRSVLFQTGRIDAQEMLPIPERSTLVRALWPNRTLGVELWHHSTSLPLDAWLRIGNGTGTLYGNDTTLPTGEARVDFVLGRTRDGEHRDDRYGLRVGVGGSFGTVFDRAGIGLRTVSGFVFDRAPVVSGTRWLAEAHLLGNAGPVQLLVEAGFARESRERDDDGNAATPRVALPAVESGGVSTELSWMIVGAHRAPRVWPGSGDRRWGAIEVAGRYERIYTHAAAADVDPSGAHVGAASVRWWAPRWVTVGVAGYAYAYDRPPVEEPGETSSWVVMMRAGLSLR